MLSTGDEHSGRASAEAQDGAQVVGAHTTQPHPEAPVPGPERSAGHFGRGRRKRGLWFEAPADRRGHCDRRRRDRLRRDGRAFREPRAGPAPNLHSSGLRFVPQEVAGTRCSGDRVLPRGGHPSHEPEANVGSVEKIFRYSGLPGQRRSPPRPRSCLRGRARSRSGRHREAERVRTRLYACWPSSGVTGLKTSGPSSCAREDSNLRPAD